MRVYVRATDRGLDVAVWALAVAERAMKVGRCQLEMRLEVAPTIHTFVARFASAVFADCVIAP